MHAQDGEAILADDNMCTGTRHAAVRGRLRSHHTTIEFRYKESIGNPIKDRHWLSCAGMLSEQHECPEGHICAVRCVPRMAAAMEANDDDLMELSDDDLEAQLSAETEPSRPWPSDDSVRYKGESSRAGAGREWWPR